jgi:hypothetical protein
MLGSWTKPGVRPQSQARLNFWDCSIVSLYAPLLGPLARAHVHSCTVMWHAISFRPALRRGVKLGLLQVGVSASSAPPTRLQLLTQRGRPHLAAAGRNNTQAFAQPLAELALKPARGVAHYGGAYP